MKKLPFALIAVMVAFQSCQSTGQHGFTLSGTIKDQPKDTKVYLEELTYTSRNGMDTSALDPGGSFSFEGEIKNNGLYQLRIGGDKAIFLVLDEKPATIEIKADTNDLTNFTYTVKGSPGTEQLRQFIVQTKVYGEAFGKAMGEYNQNVTAATPDSVKKAYEEKVYDAEKAFRSYASHFTDTVQNPIVAIFAATNLDYAQDRATFDQLEARVRKDYANLPFAQAFLAMVGDQKAAATKNQYQPKFAVGAVPPDIELQDANGKTMKLSSLQGKYVLLDFWASWCGPCRKENPNLVKAFETFRDRDFTVFSVSLDTDKDKWLAGIKKDNLSWPYHVSDLQGWKSSVCQLYGISSIPQNYLLDKNGKIIASNLRGDQLLTTLQSVLQ